MKVALLGPEGTYTHQAAEEYFENLEPVFKSTITEVFKSDIDVKLVPVENSLQGGVTETIDRLRKDKPDITGEQILKINHCILSKENSLQDIEKVYSHPQALSQSRKYIEEKKWEMEETSSTAKATENLKSGEAAIASEIAGKLNGLNILDKGIQDKETNLTRFLILNQNQTSNSFDKASIIIHPEENRPGILANILSCFSGHKVNLTHIQSRPTKKELGDYFFYLEAENPEEDKEMQKAIRCSKTYADVTLLGKYPVKKG